MTEPMLVSSRVRRAADTMRTLLRHVAEWDAARAEPGACDLMLGNPQEMPLPGLVDALRRHAVPQDKDWFAYKRSESAPRAAVAESLRTWRGLPFRPEDVFLTPGAFGGLAVLFQALLDPGDEVVYSLPPWFLYEPMLVAAGAVPVKIRLRENDNDLDLDGLAEAIGPATRAVIVNTPSNPTGRIHPPATLRALAQLLTDTSRRHGRPIWLIADESYSRLVYSDAQFCSPTEFYPYSVLVYTYGKVLLAPGQRIGFVALPPSLPAAAEVREAIDAAQIAAGWLFPNAVMQYAVADLEALSIDLVDLERKRDLMVRELRTAGYRLRSPEGTFYLWVRSPDPDDEAFCRRLAEHRVLVMPGTVFEVPGHFRISLTGTQDMLDRALPGFRAVMREVTGARLG
jgi:aspartate aminotransferase